MARVGVAGEDTVRGGLETLLTNPRLLLLVVMGGRLLVDDDDEPKLSLLSYDDDEALLLLEDIPDENESLLLDCWGATVDGGEAMLLVAVRAVEGFVVIPGPLPKALPPGGDDFFMPGLPPNELPGPPAVLLFMPGPPAPTA